MTNCQSAKVWCVEGTRNYAASLHPNELLRKTESDRVLRYLVFGVNR